MRRRVTVLIGALAALAVVPAPASAVTFGANLSRVPNSTATCLTAPLFPIANTCSAESIDPTTGESGYPPAGDGVVTRVRVRVGPTTGPMQIVEEQALRQDNPGDPGHPIYACCQAIAASAVFTPRANAITAVPVNFHVKQDLAPEASGYYVDQHLALSVLDPNVPIPAGLDPNAGVGLWFPAWKVGDERAGSYGTSGAMILINGDWQATGKGGRAPLILARRTATVRRGNALLNLLCNLSAACRGQLQLQSRQVAPRALAFGRPKARIVTYGRASFKIRAGKKGKIRTSLNAAGRRLFAHRHKAKVWLNVKVKNAATVPSVKVTLKK